MMGFARAQPILQPDVAGLADDGFGYVHAACAPPLDILRFGRQEGRDCHALRARNDKLADGFCRLNPSCGFSREEGGMRPFDR